MSIEDELLKLLFEPRLRYKGMRVSMLGIPDIGFYKKQSINNSIYRLKKKGFIDIKNDQIFSTSKGQKYIQRKLSSLKFFQSENKKNKDSLKNLIVMYDIPENKKAEREWFRWHLKKFGFEMIQRSVWVGPSPLPKEFLDYVKSINLEENLKVLRLAKPYTDKSFHL